MEGSVGSYPAACKAIVPSGQSEPPLMCLCLSNGKTMGAWLSERPRGSWQAVCVQRLGSVAGWRLWALWTSTSKCQKLGRLGSRGSYLVICMSKPSCWRDPQCTYVCEYISLYVIIITNNQW